MQEELVKGLIVNSLEGLMPARQLLLVALSLFAGCLRGAGWVPIAPEVWALKEDLAKGKGAVVLSERIHYGSNRIEYSYRVRIFSEAGRAAAQFADFPSSANLVEGRTVYSDGREVIFSSAKDMKEISVKTNSGESKHTVLEPPGISANCVVEVRWHLAPFDWASFQGEFRRWILKPYPALETTIEFSNSLQAARVLEFGSYIPEEKKDSSYQTFLFRNLPAVDQVSYLQRPLNREPEIVIFSQPVWLRDVQGEGPDAYWNAVCKRYFKEFFFAQITKGWSWKSFSKELLADLPAEDSHAKAKEILARLDARIAKRDELTHEESERFKNAGLKDNVDPCALSAAVKRGWTSSLGMYYLAFQLMQDAGIHPKLVCVANRYAKLVKFSDLNLFQFDRYVLGVEAPGKGLLLLDPQDRTLPTGAVPGIYQGTAAVQVDTDTWKVSRLQIPMMPADQNHRSYAFQHTLGDGKQVMTCESSFSGVPEYIERDQYFSSSSGSQVEIFKKSFEELRSGWVIEKAEVRNATDRRRPVSKFIQALREFEDTRRVQINPFPGMPSAISIPDNLPQTRSVPICLGYARTHRASARISLPEGFQLVPTPVMDQKNYFGRVRWSVKVDPDKSGEAILNYEMVLSESNTNELYYPALLQFLGWVQDAQSRPVILERRN